MRFELGVLFIFFISVESFSMGTMDFDWSGKEESCLVISEKNVEGKIEDLYQMILKLEQLLEIGERDVTCVREDIRNIRLQLMCLNNYRESLSLEKKMKSILNAKEFGEIKILFGNLLDDLKSLDRSNY